MGRNKRIRFTTQGNSPYSRTAKPVTRLSRRVTKLARQVGKPEMKHLDYVFTAVSPTLNGLVSFISGIAQGDTNITREGNDIRIKKMEYAFEWSIVPDTGAPDTGAFSNNRLMILSDTEATGTVITNAQVIDQTLIAETYAPRQIDTTDPKRIRALVDKKFELVSLGQQTATQAYVDMSKGTKLIRGTKHFPKGLHIRYLGTGSGQTAGGTNSLYTLFASDAAQGALVSGYVRMHFTD